MTTKLRLASSGGDVKIWDMPELNIAKAFSPHSQPVGSLCWSPNNQCLASAANDKVVVTYIKGDEYDTAEITAGEGNTCVAFNSSSRYLLTGGNSKTLNIWDMKTKSVKKTYKDHKDIVSCVAFNWNDTSIASGSVNGDILLHNVMTGQASDPLRLAKTQAVRDIQFSHFKKSLLGAVSDDGALNLWDSNTKKLSTSFASDHKGPATGLSFSPMNDMLLCSVGLDKRIVFYDVQQKKSVKVMMAESPLTSVDFMSDGGTLAVGSTRGKIYIYDLRSGSSPVNTRVAHKTSVQSLSFQSSTKVNSLGNSKSSKPVTSNTKPTPNPVPTEAQPASTSIVPTITAVNVPDHTSHTPLSKQNGIKNEESEDLFSPLREVKTAAVEAPSRQTNEPPLPGSGEASPSYNLKENNPPDGSGIFSPIGSNLSSLSTRQLHHPAEVTATTKNSLRQDLNSPRTLAVTTANEATASTVQSNRSPGARAHTDSSTGQDLVGDNRTKSSSDAVFSGNLSPSITRAQFERNQRKRFSGEYADSQVTKGSLHAEADVQQPISISPSGSLRSEKLVAQLESSGQKSPLGSPSNHRRLADDGSRIRDQSVGQSTGPKVPETVSPGESLIFDNVNHSPDPLPSGAVGMATTITDVGAIGASNAGLLPFQVQFIKNLIDESLDEFRVALHRDIVNVQVEMLRQFQIQKNELKGMLEKYSVNEALISEIERLKEENNRLKSKY